MGAHSSAGSACRAVTGASWLVAPTRRSRTFDTAPRPVYTCPVHAPSCGAAPYAVASDRSFVAAGVAMAWS